MGWVSGIVVYVMIWWVLIFMILPWGVRPETRPVSGCAAEAPARPYLGIKFALTTVLAALIWVGVHNWILQ
ncbi:MAG: DUF1467 family protein [Caedimonas sp.]|jgi:predicted secreted protein|nr:DUF1467 family protein [Caedimonas sp.]